jgi:hypothetical protein
MRLLGFRLLKLLIALPILTKRKLIARTNATEELSAL